MPPSISCSSFNISSILISGRRIIFICVGFAAKTAYLKIPLCQTGIGRLIHLVLPLRISNQGHFSSCHARRAKVAGFIGGGAFTSPEFQQGLLVNAEVLSYLRAG
jgi:hypothetical protein